MLLRGNSFAVYMMFLLPAAACPVHVVWRFPRRSNWGPMAGIGLTFSSRWGNGSVTRKWSFLSVSGHFLLHVGFKGNKTRTKTHSSITCTLWSPLTPKKVRYSEWEAKSPLKGHSCVKMRIFPVFGLKPEVVNTRSRGRHQSYLDSRQKKSTKD